MLSAIVAGDSVSSIAVIALQEKSSAGQHGGQLGTGG